MSHKNGSDGETKAEGHTKGRRPSVYIDTKFAAIEELPLISSMAAFLKAAPFLLLLFPLLFVSALAQFDTVGGNYGTGSNPLDNTLKEILADPSTGTNDAGKRDATDTNPAVPVETNLPGITFEAGPEVVDESNKRDFKTNYGGMWKLVVQNSFVSAMHMILMPNNKMIIFDASAFHISQIKLPGGKCFPFTTDQGAVLQDCWAHGVEYDIASGNLRPLTVSNNITQSSYIYLFVING